MKILAEEKIGKKKDTGAERAGVQRTVVWREKRSPASKNEAETAGFTKIRREENLAYGFTEIRREKNLAYYKHDL